MKTMYSFDTKESPALHQVGGKAMSLIQMTKIGLPVPPGIVCTVDFFNPWFDELRKTDDWQKLMNASSNDLKEICDSLKEYCKKLSISREQESSLTTSLESISSDENNELFAVRSSSPEEDLEGASFAGAYESILGVIRANIINTIRMVFASALDSRVFLYKEEKGFSRKNPHIAIIIQKQIASEKAGVAFTINPINNSYDEAVINANFGLGESVVSGLVSPDRYIINKNTGEIIEQVAGKKEIIIHVKQDGGTWQEKNVNNMVLCLSNKDLEQLHSMLKKVEEYYQKPMDTEWAFSNGVLFLLQARPITAYIPLPEDLITQPGEPKRLYLDMTLSKQGIHKALSVLGTDWLAWNQRDFMRFMFGRDIIGAKDGAAVTIGGRSYVTSNMFKMMGLERQITAWSQADSMAAKILRNNDLSEYLPSKLPKKLRGAMFGVLKNSFTSIMRALKAMKNPQKYEQWYQQQEGPALEKLEKITKEESSLLNFIQESMDWYIEYTNNYTLPMTYAAQFARAKIDKLFTKAPEKIKNLTKNLETALPHNITIEMGIAMHALSQCKEIKECETRDQFKNLIESGSISIEFKKALEDFRTRFGFRCPMELDIATLRPGKNMNMLFDQLKSISSGVSDSNTNPVSMQKKGKEEREKAYQELKAYLTAENRGKVKQFQKAYNVLATFGGYREIHKYYMIKVVSSTRRKVLAIANHLIEQGRLEYVDQVFQLKFDQLEKGIADSRLDLIALGKQNSIFYNKIKHIHNFPPVIDSRGKILKLHKKNPKEGELTGESISLGKVTGIVKVLNSAYEKQLLPGEILVARATDPGWTPLFINAAGVILEVGGLFQHGALVAREYGIPCIVGIENATTVLKDGMSVELDGTNGIIKILKENRSKEDEI